MAPEPKESSDIMIIQNACKLEIVNNSTHEEITAKILDEFLKNLKSESIEWS